MEKKNEENIDFEPSYKGWRTKQHDTSLFRMTSVLNTALTFKHNSTCHFSLGAQVNPSGFLSATFCDADEAEGG